MRISLLLVGLLFTTLSTSSAFAFGSYIGVAGGASVIHDSDIAYPGDPVVTASFDTGLGLNFSAGSNFDVGRIEGEIGYKKADVEKLSALGTSFTYTGLDVTITSFMINGLFDIKTESVTTPYLGGGIGVINAEMNDNGFKADDTVLGYQLIAGAGFSVNKNVTLDISYRFQGAASDFNFDGSDVSYVSSNIYGGVRLNF